MPDVKILSSELIKKSEQNAVLGGTDLRELMRRAGTAAAEIIASKYRCRGKKITVLCGKGNNGGDGCVIAGILSGLGANVTICTPLGVPKTENAGFYYDALNSVKKTETPDFCDADIIIDALFGTGLTRSPEGAAEKAIVLANKADCVKVAIDIPSGVICDSGEVPGAAFKADLTVTFIALKPCFCLPDGYDYCGETVVADIGAAPCGYTWLTTEKPVFQRRRHGSHKGSYGTALMFCGSYGMAGAAILAAKAALRSGAGIVKSVLSEGIYTPFTAAVPEAVCVPVKQNGYGQPAPELYDVSELLCGCDAVLIGCGLKNTPHTAELLKNIAENCRVPMCIDADGINAVCDCIDIIKNTKAPVILTPHPGEMARLCKKTVNEVERSRVDTARSFAVRNNCVLVLKGANTVVATAKGEIFINMTGNPGMATGGSGDVLAGIIVSLLAQGFSAEDAAKAAVWLHGSAGDAAAAKKGERALIPSDIIDEL